MKNSGSIIQTKCQNGLTVFYGAVNTGENYGVFGIEAIDSLEARTIIVSDWKLAKTIAKLLIEDFGEVKEEMNNEGNHADIEDTLKEVTKCVDAKQEALTQVAGGPLNGKRESLMDTVETVKGLIETLKANDRGEQVKTIEQIVEEVLAWGDTTFPDTTIDDLVFKLAEEYGELSEAALAYLGYWYLLPGPPTPMLSVSVRHQNLLDEIADNFIVLFRLTKALGADFRQVIEDKWDVIKARDYSSSNEVAE